MNHKEVNNSTESSKSSKIKKLKWVALISAGLVLLIFFGIPLYLSSSSGTNLLLGKINQSVDGQVKMDDFSVGWFKGISLTNLSYDNSSGTSITVRKIQTQPRYTSLLSGNVRLGHTVIEAPQIYVKVSPKREIPTPPGVVTTPVKQTPVKDKKEFRLEQLDLELIDGAATIELMGENAQTLQVANIASTIQISETGKPASIDMSMEVDKRSTVSAKGSVTPTKQGWRLADGDLSVQISKLELASLKPLFVMAGQDMDMSGQLNANGSIEIKDGTVQQLVADGSITDFAQGSGQSRTIFEKPVTLSARTSGMGQSLRIETLNLNSEFCNLDCSGTMQALDFEVSADLKETQRFAGQFSDMKDLAIDGMLKAAGKVNLADNRIGITAAGDVRQLAVHKADINTPQIDVAVTLDGEIDQANDLFQLTMLDLTATPGTVKISDMTLPLSPEAIKTVSMDTNIEMDMEKVWPFVQAFVQPAEDMKLSGMLNSKIMVSTQGSQIQLLTEQTEVQNIRFTRGESEPFVQDAIRLNGDVVLDTESQTIDIRKLNLQDAKDELLINVVKSNLQKTVSQQSTQLKGNLQAEYDLKTVSKFATAYIPDGLMLEGKRTDVLQFESQYPNDDPNQLMKNLNASGSFGFDKAEYNGLTFGQTQMNLNIEKGVVNFKVPKATVNEGDFQFAGIVDMNEDRKVLRLAEPMEIMSNIHLNGQLTNTMLKYLSPVFAGQSSISGFASLSCNQLELPFDSADKEGIVVDGVVQMDKVHLQAVGLVGNLLARTGNRTELDAALLPTRFQLEKGVVGYEDMEFHLDTYPTGFSGRIYLDKKLDMQVSVPYKFDVTQLRFPAVKVGEDLSGRLTLPIEGTVDAPQVRLDKLFESMLKNSQQDLIQHGLQELFKNL